MKLIMRVVPGVLAGGIMEYNGIGITSWEFWAVLIPVALVAAAIIELSE